MGDDLYTVLLAEDVRLEARDLAVEVAGAFELTALETRMRLRRSRGVVLEQVTSARAECVRAALERRGIRADCVPAGRLPRLPLPTRAVYLQRAGELLSWGGADASDEGAIAWSDLLVASAAPVGQATYQQSMGAVRFAGVPNLMAMEDPAERDLIRSKMFEAVDKAREERDPERPETEPLIDRIENRHASDGVKVFLDLIASDLSLWLRVSMDDSTYRLHGEDAKIGGAMGMSYLLKDLLRFAPQARMSTGLLALPEPGLLSRVIMADIEELTAHTTWLAYRMALEAPLPAAEPAAPAPQEPAEEGGHAA